MNIDAYFEAIDTGDLKQLKMLIRRHRALLKERRPSDDESEFILGGTGLHRAVHSEQPEVMNALIEAGIEIDARNDEGRTALHDSIEAGQFEYVDRLIEAGADVDVCSAAILGHHDRLHQLLDAAPTLANERSTELTPLEWAGYGDQVESARILVEAGAELITGALVCAASVGHVAVGRFFLERGIDPDRLDDEAGANALHAAVAMRYTKDGLPFIEMLLERGVDVSAKTRDGRTALDIAVEFERRDRESLEAGGDEPIRPYPRVIELLQAANRQN